MGRFRSLTSMAVLAATLALGISGCGNDTSGTSGGGGGSKKIRIASIIFGDDQFFHMIQAGVKDEAKKNNVEILEGNSSNKPETEQQLVENFQTKKVDAILISPLSFKGSVNALKDAQGKGIVIVTNNTGVDGGFTDGDVECSNEDLGAQTGKAAVKYINEKLGGKANIAIIDFRDQVPEQSGARTGGFKKEVTALPGVKIVTEQSAHETDKAQKLATDILTAHPEVDVIFGANEGGTSGAVLAVLDSKKAGKKNVAVFGTDVSEQLISYLLSPDDVLKSITAQKPYDMGVMSVDIALKALKKEPHEKIVMLNGVNLSRTDTAAVTKFAQQLKQWTGAGK